MTRKTNHAHEIAKAEITGQIAGIMFAAQAMRNNSADEFEKAFCARVINDLNRQLNHLNSQVAAPPKEPWKPVPPRPCPAKQQHPTCYRRDGETAVIDAGIQGRLCKGCEWKVSTLDGVTP